MKFTISVITHTAFAQAKRCVDAVLKNSKHFVLILTVQGNPEAVEYFTKLAEKHREILLLVNQKNEGFIEPTKRAFGMCKSEFFVVLNDDAVPPQKWLTLMEAEFRNHPMTAIVGPKGAPCTISESMGGVVSDTVDYIEFSCAMLRSVIFKEHGLFSPALVGAYTEDQFCSLRVRELGYSIRQADFKVPHERHQTSQRVPEVQSWITNNIAYMQKRFAGFFASRSLATPIVIRSGSADASPIMEHSVLRAIKKVRPLSKIYVETDMPDLLTGLDCIEKAAKLIPAMPGELRINLDDQPTQVTRNGRCLIPGDRIERKSTPPTVTMLYVYPLGTLEWQKMAYDFVESYLKNPPGYDHDTLIVCNGCPIDQRTRNLFARLPRVKFTTHDNTGFDLGAYIAGAHKVDSDILVLFGSNSYLTKPGWLKRFVEAWEKHGPGLYGAFASYEVMPHLNTTQLAVAPELLRRYPLRPNNKSERYSFEHGADAFWRMVSVAEYPVKLVTFDGEYDWQDWRKPPNIYRRGDQSNCLGGFRITRDYEKASPQLKAMYAAYADTLTQRNFEP